MSAISSNDGKIPVTILTGFLGAGKTTLLNYILTQDHGKKIAIIENEFGEIGIDDKLLQKNMKKQSEECIIEMMNGCICCTVRQDLQVVLKDLYKKIRSGTQINAIVIETTGMADPAPVAQTFFVDEEVAAQFRLDGIVTMVDAKHIEQHLDEVKPEGAENEAVEQVAFADRLILNKTDLVSEKDLERVEKRLKTINAFAPIQRSCQSKVKVDQVLDIKGFDLKRTLEMDPEFLDTDAEHEHDQSVTSMSVRIDGDLDLDAMEEWLGNLLRTKGADIFRMKGVLSIEDMPKKFVYQGVHMIFSGGFDEEWAEGEKRDNKLVFIGKNLEKEKIEADFKACLATPGLRLQKIQKLRFRIGDEVECRRTESLWEQGKVVDYFYRDMNMPSGFSAPYQVELNDGTLIWCPIDSDKVIRAYGKTTDQTGVPPKA